MTHTRTVVFDIGGTWFRAAVWTETGEFVGRSRRPAINFHRHPELDGARLQERLIEYLVAESQRLTAEHRPGVDVVISMGAALNGRTGFVFNSGPLWGPDCPPIDLLGELRRRDPTRNWQVINDVTAALLRHVYSFVPVGRRHGRMALITISSGIACRVFDFARGEVPTDPEHGLQGEIGHLKVSCEFAGVPVALRCDCGGMNHLNAFASGRGLEALVRHLAGVPKTTADFLAAVNAGDEWSRTVLASALQPLAGILAVMLTHDPELDPIVLVGGVVAAAGDVFLNTLLAELEDLGMYQVTDRDPDYFRRRLCLGATDDDSGLIGCGLQQRITTRDNLVVRRNGPGNLALEPVKLPAPANTDVTFRILRAAVCGTDRQILRGDRGDRATVLGHEGVAEVAAVGGGVGSFRPGELVVFNPVNPRDQDEILGHSTEGIFQRFLTVSEEDLRRRSLVERVPAGAPIEACVLAEPLGTVLYTHELLDALGPRSILIIGAGSIGVLHALFAHRVRGLEVHLASNSPRRTEWLRSRGILPKTAVHDIGDAGSRISTVVDAVLCCVPARSTQAALGLALAAVRDRGCLGLIGGVDRSHREELPGVDLEAVRRANVCGNGNGGVSTEATARGGKVVRLFGQRGTAGRHLSGALHLLASDQAFSSVLTHRLGLGALPDALQALRTQNELAGTQYLKAVVDCTSDADRVESL